MTDKEIIKALECCPEQDICLNCPCWSFCESGQLFENALDLINRQQAEIEGARICVKSYKGKYESAVKATKELQTVIKEKEAEIDTLKIQNEHLSTFWRNTQAEVDKLIEEADQFADLGKMYSEIRAEAIKEFAERLNNIVDEELEKYSLKDFEEFKAICQVLRGLKIRCSYSVKEMVSEDK